LGSVAPEIYACVLPGIKPVTKKAAQKRGEP